MPADQFILSSSWLPSPGFELWNLAGYITFKVMSAWNPGADTLCPSKPLGTTETAVHNLFAITDPQKRLEPWYIALLSSQNHKSSWKRVPYPLYLFEALGMALTEVHRHSYITLRNNYYSGT